MTSARALRSLTGLSTPRSCLILQQTRPNRWASAFKSHRGVLTHSFGWQSTMTGQTRTSTLDDNTSISSGLNQAVKRHDCDECGAVSEKVKISYAVRS